MENDRLGGRTSRVRHHVDNEVSANQPLFLRDEEAHERRARREPGTRHILESQGGRDMKKYVAEITVKMGEERRKQLVEILSAHGYKPDSMDPVLYRIHIEVEEKED